MSPFMLLFFMFYNFIMPKFGILFTLFYFLYAYSKNYLFAELNTWFGFLISGILFIAFELIITDRIFIVTYKKYIDRVSNIEPFIAATVSTFFFGIISIILGIFILEYIISLRLF